MKIESWPRKSLIVLGAGCVMLLAAERAYTKHPHVHYEEWFGFFAIAGLVGMILLGFAGQLARPLLRRDRGYYDG